MADTPPLHFFSILYRELSYAFVHSTGHDPLIARANRFIQNPAPNRNAERLIPIGLGIILKLLVDDPHAFYLPQRLMGSDPIYHQPCLIVYPDSRDCNCRATEQCI